MADAVNTIVGTAFSPSLNSLGKFAIPFFIILGIIVVGVIVWIFVSIKKANASWNKTFRFRIEDTQNNSFPLDPIIVKAKTVTLPNGVRMNFLEKPIAGKRLFPLLNYHTRPNVYDVGITADNRFFIFTRIEGIDAVRKTLNVGVRHPGIDHDFDELNNQYAKLNAQERTKDWLAIARTVMYGVIVIALLVGLIVGGKYWLDAKAIDKDKREIELRLFAQLDNSTTAQLELQNGMILLIDSLKELRGTNNLRNEINQINQEVNNV